jgi:hypothetical protein
MPFPRSTAVPSDPWSLLQPLFPTQHEKVLSPGGGPATRRTCPLFFGCPAARQGAKTGDVSVTALQNRSETTDLPTLTSLSSAQSTDISLLVALTSFSITCTCKFCDPRILHNTTGLPSWDQIYCSRCSWISFGRCQRCDAYFRLADSRLAISCG